MNNEISDHVKLLAEKAKKLNGDVLAVEGTINEPLGAFVDDYLFYSKDIQDYIASLETELDTLKVELAQYEWKDKEKEEPKEEGEYLVLAKNSEGDRLYLTSDYTFTPMGNLFDAELFDLDILAWSEIRPWKGE